MKRNEQIWWFFICLTLAVVEIALFHFTNDHSKYENRFVIIDLVPTSNLFTNYHSKDLPRRAKNQSPQKSQQVGLLQAASCSCNSYSHINARQTIPSWEKPLKSNEFRILLSCFIMVPVAILFVVFHRLARSNPGD